MITQDYDNCYFKEKTDHIIVQCDDPACPWYSICHFNDEELKDAFIAHAPRYIGTKASAILDMKDYSLIAVYTKGLSDMYDYIKECYGIDTYK